MLDNTNVQISGKNRSNTSKSYYTATRWHKFLIICLLFFVISAIGWALETAGFYINEHEFFDRGFLTLPFCTLYGFSAVILYFLVGTPVSGFWKKFARLPKNKFFRALLWLLSFALYATIASLLATSVEYITGLFFDHFFNLQLWDYSGYQNNLHGYISLEFSVYWGLLAALGMAVIFHPLKLLFAKLNYKFLACIVLFLTIALLSDFAFNILYTLINTHHYTLSHLLRNRCA